MGRHSRRLTPHTFGVRIPSSPPEHTARLACPTGFYFLLDSPPRHVALYLLHAALPQLDRGSDYESERHRFESCTPHHLPQRAPQGALSVSSCTWPQPVAQPDPAFAVGAMLLACGCLLRHVGAILPRWLPATCDFVDVIREIRTHMHRLTPTGSKRHPHECSDTHRRDPARRTACTNPCPMMGRSGGRPMRRRSA